MKLRLLRLLGAIRCCTAGPPALGDGPGARAGAEVGAVDAGGRALRAAALHTQRANMDGPERQVSPERTISVKRGYRI